MKLALKDPVKGGRRHSSQAALVFVDVITHFEFPDGDRLRRQALPLVATLARLKEKARALGIPTIYVNDNFGQWRSQFSTLLAYCLRPESQGRAFVEQLKPSEEDYIVLKPTRSAFHQSPLELLLRCLGVSSVILCGLATNSCILCTAHDASMRGLDVYIPSDGCAARSAREHSQALEHMAAMAKAKILPAARIPLKKLHQGRSGH